VLAFPLHEIVTDANGKKRTLLGDIIISLDQTKINAQRFTNSFRDELKTYIIHGILHLMGYEDTTAAKKERMFALQNKIFKKLNNV
jgi:probable rRNA maturation factor